MGITPKTLMLIFTSLNVMFIWIHELDACYRKEWRMFGFLKKLKEDSQYAFFLLAHIPLFLFTIYYMWTVFKFNNYSLWIIWNILMILHSLIHIHAKKWESDVFKTSFSLVFIHGAGITSLVNLLLLKYY